MTEMAEQDTAGLRDHVAANTKVPDELVDAVLQCSQFARASTPHLQTRIEQRRRVEGGSRNSSDRRLIVRPELFEILPPERRNRRWLPTACASQCS